MNKSLTVITGVSMGIGAAIAHLCSSAGYALGLISSKVQAMQAMNLPNAICIPADVTDY
jgi:NADP-dependent 3-hydroxy acid dehydrogenase YdfG